MCALVPSSLASWPVTEGVLLDGLSLCDRPSFEELPLRGLATKIKRKKEVMNAEASLSNTLTNRRDLVISFPQRSCNLCRRLHEIRLRSFFSDAGEVMVHTGVCKIRGNFN